MPPGPPPAPPLTPPAPAGPRPPAKLPPKPVGNDPAKPPCPPKPLIAPWLTPLPTQRGEIVGCEQNSDAAPKPVQDSEAQSLLEMHFAPSGSVPGVVQKPASQTPGLAHLSVHASPSRGGLPHSPIPSLCWGWHARSARQGGR